MTATTSKESVEQQLGNLSSPASPTAAAAEVAPAPARSSASSDQAAHDTASDHGSDDPSVLGADFRLLPPDGNRLVTRWRMLSRALHIDQVPVRHLLSFGLVALIVIQIAVLVTRDRGGTGAERVEALASAEAHAKPLTCEKPGCVLQAAETITFINDSVDPCENFFEFACGRFKEVHPSPTGAEFNTADLLRMKNRRQVLRLLRDDQYYNSSSAISKARLFFSTCMRAYQYSLNNVPDLVHMLQQFGGLDLFGTWSSYSWNFNDVLINASAVHLLDAFFEAIVWRPELSVVDLHVPAKLDLTLSISTRLQEPPLPRVDNQTRHLIGEVLRQLELDTKDRIHPLARDCNNTCIEEMTEDIVAVQEAVLAITPKRGFFALTAEHAYTLVTMPELMAMVPQVKWRRLLDAMFGVGVVPDSVSFRIPGRAYMAGVSRIIDDTRIKRLHHFLMWPVIRRYLVALGPVYSTLGEELDRSTRGREVVDSREVQCTKLLGSHMMPALHGILMASHIGEDRVQHVRDHLLKQALVVFGDNFGWMTDESRTESLKVLEKVHVDFALDNLKQTLNGLDEFYAPLQFRKLKFFDNLRNLYAFNKPGKISGGFQVRRRVDDLGMTYDPRSTTLTVPFGSLQIPWYHPDVPDYLNAATLGSLVYNTLADNFVLSPVSPDLTYLWDHETQQRFRKFALCIETALRNTSTPKTDSILTLFAHPRNISSNLSADTIAAISCFVAYHSSYRLFDRLRNQGQTFILPGMHHTTPEKAFYLSFTHTRCTNGLPLLVLPADISGNSRVIIMPKEPELLNHLFLSDPTFRETYQCKGPVPPEHAMGLCSLF
ncbi:neprilysin-11-like isoform X2 [Amphibalanus amphitrite]|nr:neprilysin-11-like isoform X2 [Amphibalanus amphitrite]